MAIGDTGMKLNFLFFVALIIILFLSSICMADSSNYYNNQTPSDSKISTSSTLIIAESDVLSNYPFPNNDTYANITLYVTHEALIINNDNVSKNVTIYTSIPIVAYKNLAIKNWTVYPKYGKYALMTGDLLPQYFTPKNIDLLSDPKITMDDMQVNYTWDDVEIKPQSAVAVAYNNYYCEGSSIYHDNSIDLPCVSILNNFSNNDTFYTMNFTLKNTGKFNVHPGCNVFFPNEINDRQILNVINISTNQLLTVANNMTYCDGTGNPKPGYMMISNITDHIDSGDSASYMTYINGTVNCTGKIYPSLIINYYYNLDDPYNLTGNVTRITPPIQVISEQPTNTSRFYYDFVSMYLPANNNFVINQNDQNIRIKNNEYISNNITINPIDIIIIALTFVLIVISIAIIYYNRYKRIKK